jgi:hypothetical protein
VCDQMPPNNSMQRTVRCAAGRRTRTLGGRSPLFRRTVLGQIPTETGGDRQDIEEQAHHRGGAISRGDAPADRWPSSRGAVVHPRADRRPRARAGPAARSQRCGSNLGWSHRSCPVLDVRYRSPACPFSVASGTKPPPDSSNPPERGTRLFRRPPWRPDPCGSVSSRSRWSPHGPPPNRPGRPASKGSSRTAWLASPFASNGRSPANGRNPAACGPPRSQPACRILPTGSTSSGTIAAGSSSRTRRDLSTSGWNLTPRSCGSEPVFRSVSPARGPPSPRTSWTSRPGRGRPRPAAGSRRGRRSGTDGHGSRRSPPPRRRSCFAGALPAGRQRRLRPPRGCGSA